MYNQMRENPILDGTANDLCLLVVQSLRLVHVPGCGLSFILLTLFGSTILSG